MLAPGDGLPRRSANPVDNLGPTPLSTFPVLSLRWGPANRAAGDSRFNRSSLTTSFASLMPVEKSGPDFHRLALPSRPKSHIRSIPKYGSGVIRLCVSAVRISGTDWCNLYWALRPNPYPGCFRAGIVAKACGYRKACRPTDEVTRALSRSPGGASGTLPRFSPHPDPAGGHHQANLPTQESGIAAACTASCAG